MTRRARAAVSRLRRSPKRGGGRRRGNAEHAESRPLSAFRDRLAGRTPRSERGGRGSSPCPGARRASSSDGESACLTRKRPLVRLQPRPSCGRSSAVERPLEARGAAGSIPAGHIQLGGGEAAQAETGKKGAALPLAPLLGSVAQPAEPPTLNRVGAGSTPAGATLGRTAIGAVPRFENGRVFGPWGFDSLSFRLFRRGRVGKTRDCSSREAGSSPAAGASRPRGRNRR